MFLKHVSKSTRTLIAGLVLGATAGSFAVAVAATTSTPKVFYACLNISGGSLNHVNTTGPVACAKGNTPISWNSKGDTGAAGPQGIQGVTGVTGPRGLQGLMGEAGPQGSKGETGAKGDTGSQGPKGDTGPSGADGQGAVPPTLVWLSGTTHAGTNAMCQQILSDDTLSSWQSIMGMFDPSMPSVPSQCSNASYLASSPIPAYGVGSRVFSFSISLGGFPASSLSGINCENAFIENKFNACRVAGLWKLNASGGLTFLGSYVGSGWSSIQGLQNLNAGDKLIVGSFTWDNQYVSPLTPNVNIAWMPATNSL